MILVVEWVNNLGVQKGFMNGIEISEQTAYRLIAAASTKVSNTLVYDGVTYEVIEARIHVNKYSAKLKRVS